MKLLFAILFVANLIAAEPMAAVLVRMDDAAKQFRAVSAHMKRAQFTAVLDETTTTDGTMLLKHEKSGTIGLIEFKDPDPRTVAIKGKSIQIFYPKANLVEIYDASKYISNIDQLLLLGFGTPVIELRKSYDIRDGGTEKLNGVDATRLELMPKSAELKKLVSKIELWIREGQSNPAREKITKPSKDYDLVDYTETKLNPALPDSAFLLKLPAGIRRIEPQK